MSVPIKPLGDRVVASLDEVKNQTASGLYLPDNAKEKSFIATVQAIGKEVKHITTGDKIIYKEYSTTEIKVDGVKYLLLKEEDVLATLT